MKQCRLGRLAKIPRNGLIVFLASTLLVFGLFKGAHLAWADTAGGTIEPPIKYWAGGRVINSEINFCIIMAGIFPIPIPFRFIEVGSPSPAKMYYLYLISNAYEEYNQGDDSGNIWSKASYFPEADRAFKASCVNKDAMPKADGVVSGIGTSDGSFR